MTHIQHFATPATPCREPTRSPALRGSWTPKISFVKIHTAMTTYKHYKYLQCHSLEERCPELQCRQKRECPKSQCCCCLNKRNMFKKVHLCVIFLNLPKTSKMFCTKFKLWENIIFNQITNLQCDSRTARPCSTLWRSSCCCHRSPEPSAGAVRSKNSRRWLQYAPYFQIDAWKLLHKYNPQNNNCKQKRKNKISNIIIHITNLWKARHNIWDSQFCYYQN